MTKKMPNKKRMRRSNSIEKTIEEGREFVEVARRRMRKPKKTKTMLSIKNSGKRAPKKAMKKEGRKPARKIIRKKAPKMKVR